MGNVTNITHVLGKSPTTYAKGDMSFSIGTVIRAHRGWPFTVIETDRNDYLDDFGIPDLENEGGYQAKLALHNHQNTVGKYVRIVPDTAEYPYYFFDATAKLTLSKAAFASPVIEASEDEPIVAYLKNGETRNGMFGLHITNKTSNTFVVTVYQNQQKPIQVGLPQTVSLDPAAVASDGSSMFIESVFERNSSIVGFKVHSTATINDVPDALDMPDTVWFSGGSESGTLKKEDYYKAWDLLRSHAGDLDQIFMAGDIDTNALGAAFAVANERDIRLEGDFPMTLKINDEIAWLNALSETSHNISFTYGKISFNDPFYPGLRATIRVSGLVTAAKAYAREASKTISDPSVEEAPAGENFGLLRGITGIRNETPLTAADKKALAGAWANYIVNSTEKGVIVWEQFTLNGDDNPYAYKRNVDVINYLYHTDAATMQRQQFRGKTDWEIINSLSKVRDRLVAKGVLVADENDEEYPEPYSIWINRNGASVEINRAIRIQNAIGPIVMKTIPL